MLSIGQTHEPEDSMAVVPSTFVNQAKGKLVASLSEVPVRLSGAGPLSAQGGCQLYERGVWELVKKPLEAGVSPDLEAEMRAGHRCCQ